MNIYTNVTWKCWCVEMKNCKRHSRTAFFFQTGMYKRVIERKTSGFDWDFLERIQASKLNHCCLNHWLEFFKIYFNKKCFEIAQAVLYRGKAFEKIEFRWRQIHKNWHFSAISAHLGNFLTKRKSKNFTWINILQKKTYKLGPRWKGEAKSNGELRFLIRGFVIVMFFSKKVWLKNIQQGQFSSFSIQNTTQLGGVPLAFGWRVKVGS